MKRHSLALVAVLTLVFACGGGTTATTDASPATTAATPATTAPTETTAEPAGTTAAGATTTAGAAGEETLMLSSTELGDVLTDSEGNTLYLFMPDEQGGEPTCYDDCAANWPAFTGTVSAGDGVDASLLATATRTDDGGDQVVYNGWPLYYFIGDEAPGDTNGQGVADIWWVVDAAGEAISG